ncbi:ABC transporter ATP-binding protein [Mesomycoplasma hyorhinis]|uniref:ABC transporter ATP-binding protein n=2 Tax=Mesomycoplasma hyorhinis TaxID=2100 RepID=A0AAJ2YP30_MESHY|nr:ABC transporter ATP-binding protein [Mesomycoplasma hyorhinis]AFX74437.1 putative ABC transporter, ATP-binding protein [Mesomycoplasma hyorhinis SK76]MXR07407.1 ABC transporter ATP-binding protein [Mesomycoplasma hyorhinis]MXR08136.1 ABC transporter ATP-binding protein [Mesomycoplasma hyorhinis]MXR08415.1 ABC transporter ATP-binding protein [Mesomycoplasma hyorhinis]MXR09608.1 ABC transporter ATP-binding protein [Mesomycoplasma hyorhinis]
MSQIQLRASNISKKFKNKIIFSNINLEIFEGDSIALLGRNGRGKTLLFNILAGADEPDTGKVELFNTDKKHPWNNMGYLEQQGKRINNIKVKDFLSIIEMTLRNSEEKEHYKFLNKLLSLDQTLDTKIANLSGGEKQKLAILQLFLKKPKIIFLDELYNNLDYISRESLINYILDYKQKHNATLLFVSHHKEEILRLANRIWLLENQQIKVDTRDLNKFFQEDIKENIFYIRKESEN